MINNEYYFLDPDNRFIVKIDTGYDWFTSVKGIIKKSRAEIAELLGIPKEQLKIVEG